MVKPVLNFRFKRNVQTGDISRNTDDWSNITSKMILEDVVFAQAAYRFDEVRTTLRMKLTEEIGREMDHMVSLISTMMSPPDGARGPQGDITNLAGSAPMTATQAGVNWSDRSINYLLWKHHHNKPGNWWQLSGKLNQALSQRSFYTSNFGPIKVDVARKTELGRDAKGRFTSRNKDTVIGRAENITSLGVKGRPSVSYTVATVTVTVLGRITAEMLPGLATGDPRKLAPANRNGSRVVDLIRNRDVRNKLSAAPRGEYRQLLDPFLSYYLTRTVPLRVNRVIDNTLQRTGNGSAANRLG